MSLRSKSKNIISKFYNFKPIYHVIVMVLLHIPYLIAYYPGLMIFDSGSSIAQFYGFKTFAASLSNNPDAILSNHHMIIFTLLMGGFIKLGEILGNQNFGFFLYILLQLILTSIIVVYVLYVLKNYVSKTVFIILYFVYGLLPILSLWEITMGKDPLYSVFLLLFTSLLFLFVKSDGKLIKERNFRIKLCLSAIAIILTKQQGSYIIIISAIFLIIAFRKNILKICGVLILPAIVYLFLFAGIILPMFNVASSGKQEMLGFMFQQTARYVSLYQEEVTEEEKNVISDVLPYEKLRDSYNPYSQDSVKFKYNQKATASQRNNYIKTWIQMFFKHPDSYIQATLLNCGGFFVPSIENTYDYMPPYIENSDILNEHNAFTMHSVNIPIVSKAFKSAVELCAKIPIFNLIYKEFTYVWLCILCIILTIIKKKFKKSLYTIPTILSILLLFITPAVEFRYVLPIVFTTPFLFASIFVKDRCDNYDTAVKKQKVKK